MKNSVVAAHCQYLTALVSGRNLIKLPSGYKVSHAFNPRECSASTALLEPGFHHLISQSFQAQDSSLSFLTYPVPLQISCLQMKIHGKLKLGSLYFLFAKDTEKLFFLLHLQPHYYHDVFWSNSSRISQDMITPVKKIALKIFNYVLKNTMELYL